MEIKSKLVKLSPFFHSAMVVFIASFFVVSIVFAATTISANISTGGDLTVSGRVTTTSATSTAYVSVALGDGSIDDLNFAGGDLYIQDDVEVDGVIYLQNSETIGNAINGLITLGGSASTTGDLYVSGGTLDLTTTTATTTEGIFARSNETATSTLSVGKTAIGTGDATTGCLEMVSAGDYYYCIINGDGTGLQCATGRCKD